MGNICWLIALTVIETGLLAGVSLDVALVKLPTRKRIGVVAYAQFARGNDLGNGRVVYPVLGILSLLLVLASTIVATIRHESSDVMVLLYVAVACTVLHSVVTALAAPVMLSIGKTSDDAKLLEEKLNRFARWHSYRAVFQSASFIVLVWALVRVARF